MTFIRPVFISLSLLLLFACSSAPVLDVRSEWPEAYAADKEYVVFLHGSNVYRTGTLGQQAQEQNRVIAEQIAALGSVVILDQRTYGVKVYDHSRLVSKRISLMLEAGVPAKNITVVGYSSGANGAYYVAATLLNPDMGYVYLTGCHKRITGFPRGEILALYDERDGQEFGSCAKQTERVKSGLVLTEKSYNSGQGHRYFSIWDEAWGQDMLSWLSTER